MEDKKQSLFRKKSLESIQNPEVLDDYLRVTSPGVWMLIAGIILIVIGAIIWGVFGHIDSTADVAVYSSNGQTICLVPESALESMLNNKIVTVEEKEYVLSSETVEPISIDETVDVYVRLAGNLQVGDIVYPVAVETQLKEGVYTGKILLERITPISFLWD